MQRDELIKKILKKIKTGRIDSMSDYFEKQKIDFAANIRYEYIDGGNVLLVHDIPIAKEMIQPYADGKHYKTAEAIDGIFVEYSPLSVSHPDLQFSDMTEEDQIKNTIGYMLGGFTKDNKKYTDFLFFVDKTPKNIINKIEKQQSIDVSIGFQVVIDDTPGDFNGEHYDKKQTKITIDHTAILPDEVGRASFKQGVGIGADSSLNIDRISNGFIVRTWEGDNHIETFYETEEAAKEAIDLNNLFDDAHSHLDISKNKQGGIMDPTKVADTLQEIGVLKDQLKKAEDSIKAKDAEIVKLIDMKDKAEKYDALVKQKEDTKKATLADLREKILKHEKAKKGDAFKEFLDRQESVEDLQMMLAELNSQVNGLPGAKDNDPAKKPTEDMADKAMKEAYEKANPGKKVL